MHSLTTAIAAEKYTVTVLYDQSLEKAVRVGNYDWVDGRIAGIEFPASQRRQADVEILLTHFNRPICSEEATAELEGLGFRPIDLRELLAFGATHPDVQRGFIVAALVPAQRNAQGFHYVPFLHSFCGHRDLYLAAWQALWNSQSRFASVLK